MAERQQIQGKLVQPVDETHSNSEKPSKSIIEVIKEKLSFFDNMLYDTFLWFVFSVILGGFEFLVALVIFSVTNRPLHFRALQDGSVVAFIIGLASSSYGVYYLRVDRKIYRWRSALFVLSTFLIVIIGLIIYLLLVLELPDVPVNFKEPPHPIVAHWTIGLIIWVIITSLFINFTAAEDKIRKNTE